MQGILIWNCRGARKQATADRLRSLCQDHRLFIVALVESHLESLTRREADALLGRRWEFAVVPSVGRSGGIVVLWLPQFCSITMESPDRQVAICSVSMVDGFKWGLGIVYASTLYHSRRDIWAALSSVIQEDIPFLVGGDFNCVLKQEEKRGGKPFQYSVEAREFEEFMILNDLIDAGFEGPVFTWCNNRDVGARVWVRQDRILINSCAANAFPGFRVQHLIRVSSDHCPLLFTANSLNFQNFQSWIRFEDIWLDYPESYSIVGRIWNQFCKGSAAVRLARRCFRALGELRQWHGDRIKSLTAAKMELEERIGKAQMLEASSSGFGQNMLDALRGDVLELNRVEGQISTWWRQRAKVRWMTEGDRNTAFFHSSATSRRRANRILSLDREDGSRCDNQQEILDIMTRFYQQKWVSSDVNTFDIPEFGMGACIPEEMKDALVRSVTEAEVKAAVFSLGRGRSPGIDGVTGSFYQGFWQSAGTDVGEAVMQFFNAGVMPERWKQTLIVLLPKKEYASRPADFRPISLCTTVYKVVAKILVSRLKPILPMIISSEQGAFVPGRLISDNVFLAQEAINRLRTHTSPHGSMVLKVDMEQAYDRMEWGCLRATMLRFQFPEKWIGWIMRCISNPTFSIMVNGGRSTWITAHCGFRQGCPLSPYLFILCSELLSRALKVYADLPVPLGIRCSPNGPLLSHLLYADDVLIMAKADAASC